MKKLYITSIALLGIVSVALAQGSRYNPSLSVGLQISQPIGEFDNYYEGNPFGISGQLAGPVGGSPFQIGMSAAWNSMASMTEDIAVFVGTDIDGDDVYESGSMTVKSNNNRYMALGRFSPFSGGFQIYGDALIGFETFTTKTEIKLDDGSSVEATDKQRHHWDAGVAMGWAAGIKIKMTNALLLEGRFEKLEGGKSTFVDPESVQVGSEGELTFSTIDSKTNKFTVQIGLSIEF
jgi:opacity protein-like surface antigen